MMLCLFGYMDLMIIIKWHTNYEGVEYEAPSIITLMVGLFLELGVIPDGIRPLFPGQRIISNLLICKSLFKLIMF